MSNLRYGLVEQLHFLATDPDNRRRDVVVTIQRWKSTTSPAQIYVRTHDGVEHTRRFVTTDLDRARIDSCFTRARHDFGGELMSDDLAADTVARRGGPKPKWCHAVDCGAQVPYAAGQCAEGHPVDRVNAGTYVMGAARRPVLTVLPGGKR